MPLDPSRVVDELKDLRRRTGTQAGAQRVCWSDTWLEAREWMRRKLVELGAEVTLDEAGNQWATLAGETEDALLIGGHIDSVPDGGWLDGSLNLLAGVAVLRRVATEGTPPITLQLVDWADEEGARFGVSLFGSSAASGNLDTAAIARLKDRDSEPVPEVLARCGVTLERVLECRDRLANARAYLELHIEQGPILESRDLPLAVVEATFGVERHLLHFSGQASHAGSTPMNQRRDSFLAASRVALEVRDFAIEEGGVGTVGSVRTRPGIATAVAGHCEVTVDQRHGDLAGLERMRDRMLEAAGRVSAEEGVEVTAERLWRIDPISFDSELIELARGAVEEVAGEAPVLASGPLHDAAETARAGVPTVMLFVQSLRGLSHTREEDTLEEHIELSVEALDRLTATAMRRLAG